MRAGIYYSEFLDELAILIYTKKTSFYVDARTDAIAQNLVNWWSARWKFVGSLE